jgi:hypothetical protein
LKSSPDSHGHSDANDAGPSNGVSIMALVSDFESSLGDDSTLCTDVIIPPSYTLPVTNHMIQDMKI